MTYTEIKEKKQNDYNALFTNLGVFWAFSDEQFDKGLAKFKETRQEGEKLVSIGAGGYMPENNVQALRDGTKAIDKAFKDAIKATKARDTHILYELNNHEAFYTGTITDTLDALGDDYTADEVQAVWKANFKNETKNY